MWSLKKLCSHDDFLYDFLIRDAEGRLILQISDGIGSIKLNDFLEELRKQTKKIGFLEELFYLDQGDFIVFHKQLKLGEILQMTKNYGSVSLFVSNSFVTAKIAEIFVECSQCEKEKKHNGDSSTLSSAKKAKLKSISSKRNSDEVNEILHETLRILTTQEKLCNSLQNKQKESGGEESQVLSQLNDSSTVPPLWFKEYMETMKNDMVHKITYEVSKKVTKKMIKHLDCFLQYIPNKQCQLSNTFGNPQYSFESIEKKQSQKRSQDKEQSSDTSIERIEESQNADIARNVQVTKDERSTVSSKKIVKDITKMMNKTSANPMTPVSSEKHEKSGSLSKKNRRETTLLIEEQSSDKVSIESQNAIIAKDPQLNLSEMKFLKDKIREVVLDEENISKKHHQRDAQIAMDNLDDAKSQGKPDENSFVTNPKLRPMRSADWKPGKIENGFHMSCSVTGYQMLDENQQNKDIFGRCSDTEDDDKINFFSCDQEDEDDTFEIIQTSTSEIEDVYETLTCLDEPVAEQQRHDSNPDSPSFELLTEPSSPCSIYITEDHFAANEGKSNEENPQSNDNNSFADCGGYQPEFDESVKSMNTDLEKRSGDAYSFVTETLSAQDLNSFCKSLRAKQRSNEVKYSRDDGGLLPEDTCGLYDDVRNSHTSYLTVQTHCDCQSQCANSGDLTQSFHSHTTSINDITDVSHRLVYTDNSHSSQMPSTNAQDATVIPKSNLDPHVGSDRMKNARMNERHDADNYPKCHTSTTQDVYTHALHLFHRAN